VAYSFFSFVYGVVHRSAMPRIRGFCGMTVWSASSRVSTNLNSPAISEIVVGEACQSWRLCLRLSENLAITRSRSHLRFELLPAELPLFGVGTRSWSVMGEATTEVYSCNNDVVLCACLVWAIWLRVYKHVVYTAPVYRHNLCAWSCWADSLWCCCGCVKLRLSVAKE